MRRERLLAIAGTLALLAAACSTAATPTPPRVATATATQPSQATAARPVATPTLSPTVAPASAGPKYGGVLRHRANVEPPGWDPGRLSVPTSEFLQYAYPRLFTYYSERGKAQNECGKMYPVQGELATGFKWVDDTTLDVTINRGVKLPPGPPLNGREVTADDVVFTFNRTFFVTKMALMQPSALITQEVKKVDDYTIRFKLKSPNADYVEQALTFIFAPIQPPETLSKPGDPSSDYTIESHYKGSYGRFRFAKYTPGVSMEFKRNPDHFMKGLPFVDEASVMIIPDDATAQAAMKAGKVDSAFLRNPDLMEAVRFAGIPATICPYAGMAPANIKLTAAEFQDVNVRRAVSMAVDRTALNKAVWHGFGYGGYSFIPEPLGKPWYMTLEDYPPEVRRWLTYDVKAAKELMAKTAYAKGFTTSIIYAVHMGGMAQQSEALSAMLQDLGVVLKIDRMTATEFTAITGEFPWDKPGTRYVGLRIGQVNFGVVGDLYDHFYSKSIRNQSVTNDPKLDRMLEEQQRTLDPVRRQQIVKDIQVHLVDQMYAIPLPVGPFGVAHQPYVKGLYYVAPGFGYDSLSVRDVWLDK